MDNFDLRNYLIEQKKRELTEDQEELLNEIMTNPEIVLVDERWFQGFTNTLLDDLRKMKVMPKDDFPLWSKIKKKFDSRGTELLDKFRRYTKQQQRDAEDGVEPLKQRDYRTGALVPAYTNPFAKEKAIAENKK